MGGYEDYLASLQVAYQNYADVNKNPQNYESGHAQEIISRYNYLSGQANQWAQKAQDEQAAKAAQAAQESVLAQQKFVAEHGGIIPQSSSAEDPGAARRYETLGGQSNPSFGGTPVNQPAPSTNPIFDRAIADKAEEAARYNPNTGTYAQVATPAANLGPSGPSSTPQLVNPIVGSPPPTNANAAETEAYAKASLAIQNAPKPTQQSNWFEEQISARETAAKSNTLANPVTERTPGYFELIAPTYPVGSPQWFNQVAQAKQNEPGGAVANTLITPERALEWNKLAEQSEKERNDWWTEQIAGREAEAKANTLGNPLTQAPAAMLNSQPVISSGAQGNNYFNEVSKVFENTPVLSFFYGLGANVGREKTQALSGWLKAAPIESLIFTGGRIFEGREDVKIAQKNYADLYQSNLDAGLINKDSFTGTPEQYSKLASAKNAADVAVANQNQLEAPIFGAQTVPATMALAGWSEGASKIIKSAGDSLIAGGDTLFPQASPVTRFVVGTGEGVASLVPFLALTIPALEWSARNPAAMSMAIVPGFAQQAQTMAGQARDDLPRFGGNLAGMLIAGKVVGDVYETFPYRLKYGEVRLPIETPEGLPKTQTVEMGYNRILESVKENGIETYNRAAAGEPQKYILQTQEQPIQYSATWKGVYLDVQGRTQIFGKTLIGGSPYEGKYPVAGVGFEAGGEFLGAMRDRPYIGPTIETIVNVPGVRSAVGYIERSSAVPTGLWVGPESVRRFGAASESSISGAIDFLGLGQSPAVAALKLQAAERILPAEDVAAVRSLIDLREITQRHPGLITVKEPYGEITPTSMSPEAFGKIMDYMNYNAADMRTYGSLVGRQYTGEFGRSSLGDVDALLKSSVAQTHAEAMSDILLKTEFGAGKFEAIRTEEVYSTIGKSGKSEYITNTKIEYRDTKTGDTIFKLETVPSQITDVRITGTKPGVGHVLDLHPIKDLKYSESTPGINVKSIPVQDIIWGKQTIGNPPIGTVIVRRGESTVVVEMGGRVKDFFDSYAFARTAAADAYLNPKIALSDAIRLERASSILGERVGAVAKTETDVSKFLSEMRDPFTTSEVQSAKMTKILDASRGSSKYYSGLPMDDYAISDSVGDLTDRIYRSSFAGPISSSQYAMFDRYSVSIDDYSDRYSDDYEIVQSSNFLGSQMGSVSRPSAISDYQMSSMTSLYGRSNIDNPSNARISGPSESRTSLIDIPYGTEYPVPYGPSKITPYNPKTPPYNPSTITPYNPLTPPYGSPVSPPGTPPARYTPKLIHDINLDWIRKRQKRLPARHVELFSFELGTDTLIPRRFGLGGISQEAIARNPRAAYIPGFRGRAQNILRSDDIAPNRLFDILDNGPSRQNKRRTTIAEDLLS